MQCTAATTIGPMGLDLSVAALALSVLWSADLWSHMPIVQPMSGAPFLVPQAGMLTAVVDAP